MLQQYSLFKDDHGALAGLVPVLRAAMNRAAGADAAGRKLLVDRINEIARQAGLRLTTGNTLLECVINRLKPAHTHVIFAYGG